MRENVEGLPEYEDVSRVIPGPHDPEQMRRFVDSYFYREGALFIDEVCRMDEEEKVVEAIVDTERHLPISAQQRIDSGHPAHMSAGEMLMVTGCLGSLHAWFFYGCHWDEGWAGFGSRIHRADFKSLARIGPPLDVISREKVTRVGPKRLVLRATFEFRQEDRLVYLGDQTAMYFKERNLD
jgi:hypothetical protein